MTVSEPPGEQPPEDNTALLTAALNHYWTLHDGRFNRAFQILNYYLVATAILFAAYTGAINGKHYGIAAALALAGLGLTVVTTGAGVSELKAATQAEPVLTQLQKRMADGLGIDPDCMVVFRAGMPRRRVAVLVTFGLVTLLDISGLIYALNFYALTHP
jgi:hypothetical protein